MVVDTPAARQAGFEAWSPIVYAVDAVCRSLDDRDRGVVERCLTRVTDIVEHSAITASTPGSG